jgi:hypothetical protein
LERTRSAQRKEEVMKLFQARKEKKQQVATARSIYAEFANAAASSDPAHARALAATFRENPERGALSEKERKELSATAFRAYAENVLADDHVSDDEEVAFGEVAGALDVEQTDLGTTFSDLLPVSFRSPDATPHLTRRSRRC